MYLDAKDYIVLADDAHCHYCECPMAAGEQAPTFNGHIFDSLACRRAFIDERDGGI